MFCWELGGGLGHVTKAVLLAERLLDEGCEVTFAFRDLAEVHALLPMNDYRLVQSPIWIRELAGMPEPANYAELLLRFGFGSATGLIGLSRAWRSLFEAFSIDLVIADHAPNALLAARGLKVPVALYGNGFFAPPTTAPLPPYRTWEACPNDRLAAAEALALKSANQCLQAFDMPPMTNLCDLLVVDESFLCTVLELDHYQGRSTANYVGPVYVDQVGTVPAWPVAAEQPVGKKVFAYLKAQMLGLAEILHSLSASGASVLVYCAGVDVALQNELAGGALRFVSGLVNLKAVMDEADLVVCGGTDTAYCALFNGVPVLGTPETVEQRITVERIAQAKAGLWGTPGLSRQAWSLKLRELLVNPEFRQRARDFSITYAAYSPAQSIEAIALRCLEIAGRDGTDGNQKSSHAG